MTLENADFWVLLEPVDEVGHLRRPEENTPVQECGRSWRRVPSRFELFVMFSLRVLPLSQAELQGRLFVAAESGIWCSSPCMIRTDLIRRPSENGRATI